MCLALVLTDVVGNIVHSHPPSMNPQQSSPFNPVTFADLLRDSQRIWLRCRDHPVARIDKLLPWNWAATREAATIAA